jgi:hypothetical protein
MDKKRIISGITVAVLLSLFIGGIAKAQYFNLTTYYPISSDQYIQSLNNGVMQNTAYTLGQVSNASVLLPDLLEIFFVLVVIGVILRYLLPLLNK